MTRSLNSAEIASARRAGLVTGRLELDDQNPWPGPAAYDEDSSGFFYGRAEETHQLCRLIQLAPLTVVYGKSGLGKTSLLQAGVFPLLRDEHYLPVYLRLDFSDASTEPPLQQVMRRLSEELVLAKAEHPAADTDESLWEYLHRKHLEIWSEHNFLLTPVLVFDQFEELFSRSGRNAELIRQVFDDLADLIENRIPTSVANDVAKSRRSRLDLLSQPYRVVLSFREDFLPEVRTWEQKVPTLLRNYLRLEPMSRLQSIAAVERAGKAVLEEGVAPHLVDFVGKLDRTAGLADSSAIIIEPVLLSLCCYQLNRRRAPDKKIDRELVENVGQDILESFYGEALDDPDVKGPPEVARFIEDYLVQGDHFRGDYPKEEAVNEGKLTAKQLDALTDRHRLLRIVHHADTARVELIHDRLVPIVKKARDERKVRQRQEEQERQALEAQTERDRERARSEELQRHLKVAKWSRNIAALAAIVSFILILWGLRERSDKEQMRLSAAVGVDTSRLAEGRLALGVGREPLEQTMYRGLAAYRLTKQGMSQAKAASLTTLHYVLENSGHLRKALTVRGLVPTPALAYSPDGKFLAVGGEDGRIRLLDAETYHETSMFDCGQPSTESVWTLAFNNDGKRLAAGYAVNGGNEKDASGLVCVFDLQRSSILRKWSARELWRKSGEITSVAYIDRPGMELVVSGGSETGRTDGTGVLRVLDVNTGAMRELPHHEPVVAVAASPDGQTLVSGGEDEVIRIWKLADVGNPKARHLELRGHEATIQQLMFSPSDPLLVVSAGDDGRIIVWNVKEPGCRTQETKQETRIYGISVSTDGMVAAAGADGRVLLFRLAEEKRCALLKDEALPLQGLRAATLDVIPDGVLLGHGGLVLAVAFNREGNRLASAGRDGSIRIWGPKTEGFSLAQLEFKSSGSVTAVAISPDGKSIAAGDDKGDIHLWDRPGQNGEPQQEPAKARWNAHILSAIRSLAYIQIGNHPALVSGGDDGLVKRWDIATGNLIGLGMEDGSGPIRSIAVSPDGKFLAAGHTNGPVRFWDVATGRPFRKFNKPPDASEDYVLNAVGFTQDSKHLAVGSNYSGIRVIDIEETNSERTLLGHENVKSFSHGAGKWLLSAGLDGSILEWQQAALQTSRATGLKKHDEFKFRMGFRDTKPLTSMETSADGGLILTGGSDGLVQLWDGVEHVLIGARFLGHQSNEIRAVALASDGDFFVTADDSTILVWPGPGQWADIVCSKLVWNMSRVQWRDWVSTEIPYKEQCPGLPIEPGDPARDLK
jgi:WD40 repeat protein